MDDKSLRSLDGVGRLKCEFCGHRSHPGLGAGRCPFHWSVYLNGLASASEQYPGHPSALRPEQIEPYRESQRRALRECLESNRRVNEALKGFDGKWGW